jgi:hypothetical protein
MATSEEHRGLTPGKPRVAFCRHAAGKILRDRGIIGPPVPVEDLARELGITVAVRTLGHGVSGTLTEGAEGARLDLAPGEARVRHRFTVAHELGHRTLQHHRQETEVAEREADIFAGALLVPAEWLRKDVKTASSRSLQTLARRYDVSTSVILIAAKDARLLDLLTR